ncbi:leukocyte elastase inhibitor-like [Ornithodoros turicata]|uniref:leukocyte elastase inhibitor-like n=1 Tax=Ornithodoros turicata TaxID=34597 RepID=UPI0031398B83
MLSALLTFAYLCAPASTSPESPSLVEANNRLGINILRRLSLRMNNVVLSPVSVSAAIALVYLGAKGVSEEELAEVLGIKMAHFDGKRSVEKGFAPLLDHFRHLEKEVNFHIANAFLVQKEFPVLEEYKEYLTAFGVLYKEVIFAASEATQINEWFANQTRGFITNVTPEIHMNTVMAVINAVYFKGDWQKPFVVGQTKKGYFRNLPPPQVLVDMMTQVNTFRVSSSKELDAELLELPYESPEFSMVVILPNAPNGYASLLDKLDAVMLQRAIDDLDRAAPTQVNVTLPRFRMVSQVSLVDMLRGLGIQSIFEIDKANLTGISDVSGLIVSDIMHKAVIEVDEKGSESAGTGALGITFRAGIHTFVVDHPFLFFVRYKPADDLILFMGVISSL